ncbi:MAG: hypothetical protein QMD71_00370 [bacterium]|nr:hypothetical protein [bacterium]
MVETTVNGEKEPEYYNVNWSTKGFPSGVYFAKFVSKDCIKAEKLILLR